MKTINIKGKEYVPVVERVKEFHKLYPKGSITTEILSTDDKRVIIQATVILDATSNLYIDESGRKNDIKFTGHSQAEWGKGMMGGVALEVAETSAIGRALGFANIGLLDGIASADEIRKVDTKKGMQGDDGVGF
jgi:hypothetical protein